MHLKYFSLKAKKPFPPGASASVREWEIFARPYWFLPYATKIELNLYFIWMVCGSLQDSFHLFVERAKVVRKKLSNKQVSWHFCGKGLSKRPQLFNATDRNIFWRSTSRALATLLRRVATCWVLLVQNKNWSNFPCNISGCCMMLHSCGQVRALSVGPGHAH